MPLSKHWELLPANTTNRPCSIYLTCNLYNKPIENSTDFISESQFLFKHFRRQRSTEAHVRKVKSLFTNLDADESGYISLKELEQNMHKRSASWLKRFGMVGHLFWMEIDSQHSETLSSVNKIQYVFPYCHYIQFYVFQICTSITIILHILYYDLHVIHENYMFWYTKIPRFCFP